MKQATLLYIAAVIVMMAVAMLPGAKAKKDDSGVVPDCGFMHYDPATGTCVFKKIVMCADDKRWSDHTEDCEDKHRSCPAFQTWSSYYGSCVPNERIKCTGPLGWSDITGKCEQYYVPCPGSTYSPNHSAHCVSKLIT